jgi:hypothetical protein
VKQRLNFVTETHYVIVKQRLNFVTETHYVVVMQRLNFVTDTLCCEAETEFCD